MSRSIASVFEARVPLSLSLYPAAAVSLLHTRRERERVRNELYATLTDHHRFWAIRSLPLSKHYYYNFESRVYIIYEGKLFILFF